MHALQTTAETGSKPMQKAPIRLETRDDRLTGTMLAAEAVALAKGNSNKWRELAMRIIGLTVEARAVFINALKAEKAALTKGQVDHGFDAKYSKGNTASFGTQLSKLTIIAAAFNGGATVEGWLEFTNKQISDRTKQVESTDALMAHGGYETLATYARTFSTSTAGRKADDWITKFGKFLERNKPAEDDGKGLEAYDEAVKLFNKLNPPVI